MRRRRRSYNYKFTEKTHSVRGIWALVLALLSIGLGIAMIMISFWKDGAGDVYLGSGGILSMLLAFAAFLLAVSSLREEGSYRVFPVTATVVSLLGFLCWIAVYAVGFLEM